VGDNAGNVLGALNAITHELLTITNETYITSEEVCALLRKIAVAHIDQVITVILDMHAINDARKYRTARTR